jgi:hypothetical protein
MWKVLSFTYLLFPLSQMDTLLVGVSELEQIILEIKPQKFDIGVNQSFYIFIQSESLVLS